ncbi:HAD-like protein [Punctularia strigosozonata HHB-11173 SS5]|uniref:HAD-like protein n=1 Tax=Punctularia strigosozonata (strain HHB-11173) TaxID=741275 RepID=UPI00044170E6|nr:HAD-like protein [Punctularia strigosozonata HHB-11173 SS5]EIN06633.1 HAD-like protein [Punctularia strigosozonata HHB-11173 SS5]
MHAALLARRLPTRAVSQSLRSYASKPPNGSQSPSPASNSEPTPPAPTPETPQPSTIRSLDFTSTLEDDKKQRTGAKSSKDSLSSIEKKRRIYGRVSLLALLLGAGAYGVYLGREWEEEELKAKRLTLETAPSTWSARARTRFTDLFDFFSKPQWNELLPPPLPAPYQKPLTLLIDLDDFLVTSTWDRQHGWRTAKRPGVDYFLAYLSQFYEIVLFTSQHYYTALPIVDKLDPHHFYIVYQLFRESMTAHNGEVVKDLSYLNRDLSKVILVDTNPDFVKTHPENAIIVPKWKGDPKDKGLIALIPFLESIGIYKPADVRPILEAYRGKDIPLEYAKKEAEAKLKHIEEWKASGAGKGVGRLTFSSLFGGSSDPAQSSPIPPTYLEAKRAEAQRAYREEQLWIEQNRAQLEKEKEEQDKAMQAEMSGSLWKMLGVGAGGPPAQQQQESSGPSQAAATATATAAAPKAP